eukprot:TRINITY_DN13275_c0_g1_i1.p1 TRINITY_DN13275_c0_g1~~TRINITY_DN13275_c0_g1_i1.p1  ORF type:complete len:1096 (-),score=166.12 TRINITY_DN13275_c0_g1_i1:194-3175(-)
MYLARISIMQQNAKDGLVGLVLLSNNSKEYFVWMISTLIRAAGIKKESLRTVLCERQKPLLDAIQDVLPSTHIIICREKLEEEITLKIAPELGSKKDEFKKDFFRIMHETDQSKVKQNLSDMKDRYPRCQKELAALFSVRRSWMESELRLHTSCSLRKLTPNPHLHDFVSNSIMDSQPKTFFSAIKNLLARMAEDYLKCWKQSHEMCSQSLPESNHDYHRTIFGKKMDSKHHGQYILTQRNLRENHDLRSSATTLSVSGEMRQMDRNPIPWKKARSINPDQEAQLRRFLMATKDFQRQSRHAQSIDFEEDSEGSEGGDAFQLQSQETYDLQTNFNPAPSMPKEYLPSEEELHQQLDRIISSAQGQIGSAQPLHSNPFKPQGAIQSLRNIPYADVSRPPMNPATDKSCERDHQERQVQHISSNVYQGGLSVKGTTPHQINENIKRNSAQHIAMEHQSLEDPPLPARSTKRKLNQDVLKDPLSAQREKRSDAKLFHQGRDFTNEKVTKPPGILQKQEMHRGTLQSTNPYAQPTHSVRESPSQSHPYDIHLSNPHGPRQNQHHLSFDRDYNYQEEHEETINQESEDISNLDRRKVQNKVSQYPNHHPDTISRSESQKPDLPSNVSTTENPSRDGGTRSRLPEFKKSHTTSQESAFHQMCTTHTQIKYPEAPMHNQVLSQTTTGIDESPREFHSNPIFHAPCHSDSLDLGELEALATQEGGLQGFLSLSGTHQSHNTNQGYANNYSLDSSQRPGNPPQPPLPPPPPHVSKWTSLQHQHDASQEHVHQYPCQPQTLPYENPLSNHAPLSHQSPLSHHYVEHNSYSQPQSMANHGKTSPREQVKDGPQYEGHGDGKAQGLLVSTYTSIPSAKNYSPSKQTPAGCNHMQSADTSFFRSTQTTEDAVSQHQHHHPLQHQLNLGHNQHIQSPDMIQMGDTQKSCATKVAEDSEYLLTLINERIRSLPEGVRVKLARSCLALLDQETTPQKAGLASYHDTRES